MSILELLYAVSIRPLQMLFEVIYMAAFRMTENPGISIWILSLAINLLVLPLYARADAMQEEERQMELKLRDGVNHIKKTFHGDEKMMILQEYYRQNHYRPTDVFKGSISLLLEIPFFVAAYQFLSHLGSLQGMAFGPIKDLGAADGLIMVGSIAINVLPILMTAVNLVSCVIFTKGYPTKTKVQLYAMALFFLVFLYNSPSGLVMYWTLNNIFSLGKTIVYKIIAWKKEKSAGQLSVASEKMEVASKDMSDESKDKTTKDKTTKDEAKDKENNDSSMKFFLAAGVYLTILLGMVIPSQVIKSSPQEFVNVTYYMHPLWYVIYTTALAFGTFVLWMGVFYWLTAPRYKKYFELGMAELAGIFTMNYMFFGKDIGTLSPSLVYELGWQVNKNEIVLNVVAVILLAACMVAVMKWGKKVMMSLLIIASSAFVVMTGLNAKYIDESKDKLDAFIAAVRNDTFHIDLSREGKNVIVVMMDRALGEYLPYIFNEKPELKETYSGFTAYTNVISFGGYTNFGSPALYGGYEYTPVEMNKRDSELLVDKHNEALKVMPLLFMNNGYRVTVTDPTYANYSWGTDTGIFDPYPAIYADSLSSRYAHKEVQLAEIEDRKRNFFCYSLMKSFPLLCQNWMYNDGQYNQDTSSRLDYSVLQIAENNYVANGMHPLFNREYSVLENLPNITNIVDDATNSFFMMSNETTHEPMMLQLPDYTPSNHVDNTEYEVANEERFTVDGVTLKMDTNYQIIHYQTNMAAILKLGQWLDYMKEEGIYDNTRVIIVSDHGRSMEQLEDLMIPGETDFAYDLELYYPMLLVKDFGATEFNFSDEFMTNGDVPTLATKDIIENPVNPSTGKCINNDEKYAHDQYILASYYYDVNENNGYQYIEGPWLSVHDNMRDLKNWTIVNREGVFPEQ